MAYPVHIQLDRPERFSRLQLMIRFAVLAALAMAGISFGSIVPIAYLALPVYVASRVTSLGAAAYARDEAARLIRVLHWFASASVWAGLSAERMPAHSPAETVQLLVSEPLPLPSARGAMRRVVTGLPSALVLALLCVIGGLVWLWAALSILLFEHVGPGAWAYLTGLSRWSVRLLAYQACLVDEYPPFALGDETLGSQSANLPV